MTTENYVFGDALAELRKLPDGIAQCCVTFPPYWNLRKYLDDDAPEELHELEVGQEETPEEYVNRLVEVFREVRRVLKDDGTLWLNLGDSYAGSRAGDRCRTRNATDGKRKAKRPATTTAPGLKNKDLVLIPARVALALQADGWWVRSDIIWKKPNPIPESVEDRPTKSHEHLFLLSKAERYYYDGKAIAEPSTGRAAGNKKHKHAAAYDGGDENMRTKGGLLHTTASETRNARDVWTISTQPYKGSHYAVMPPALAQRCILAGSRIGDLVIDPFLGSGTVGEVAEVLGRRWFGIDLDPKNEPLIRQRTKQLGLFREVHA